MLACLMIAWQLMPCGAAYLGPVQPCNLELTEGTIFIGAPFLPAAVALKAAETQDARVAHPDATHWTWSYRPHTHALVSHDASGRPGIMTARCEALDAPARRAWVAHGGEDVPAATLVCTLNSRFKNGDHALLITLNADLEVLGAKQLWRDDEGTVLCHLPRKPPSVADL